MKFDELETALQKRREGRARERKILYILVAILLVLLGGGALLVFLLF